MKITEIDIFDLLYEPFKFDTSKPIKLFEAFRLMGVSDEDFDKVKKVVSSTSLYKLAGNAIVVDVLYYIFKQMI